MIALWRNQLIAESLMVPFAVIVRHKLVDDVAQTSLPEENHRIETFFADRALEPYPASASLVVCVDNTPPETTIDAGPSGEIFVGNVTFTFSGFDGGGTPAGSLVFSYQLDGGAWSAFGSDTTVTFPSLAEGSHTFAVKARDLAGNEDLSPATQGGVFWPQVGGGVQYTGEVGSLPWPAL